MDASFVVLRFNLIGSVTETHLADSFDDAKQWAEANTSLRETCIIYKAMGMVSKKQITEYKSLHT